MTPYSDKSKKWRELNKDSILQWKKKFDELLNRRAYEGWDAEKFEMEIGSSLSDQDLMDIWFFITSYVARSSPYSKSPLVKFYKDAINEIRDFGTVEPSRKRILLKSVETTRRKMSGK